MSRFYVVQGQTQPINVQLLRDGVAVDLSNVPAENISLILRGLNGAVIDPAGTIEILDASSGKISFVPVAESFQPTPSPYTGRWRVVDSDGKVGFFPNREFDQWIIRQ